MTAIHVVGGAKGIGKWFVENVFSKTKMNVTVYDLECSRSNHEKVVSIVLNYNIDFKVSDFHIQNDDIFIVAVPKSQILTVFLKFKDIIPEGTTVFEMCSEKNHVVTVFKEVFIQKKIYYCGLHPLFGPQVKTPFGQTITFSCDQINGIICCLLDIFKQHRFNLHAVSASDHDKAMLYIQTVTHFCLLTFMKTIVECPISISKLLRLRTPPFSCLFSFAGRILAANHPTYLAIQSLEGANDARINFVKTASNLATKLESSELAHAEFVNLTNSVNSNALVFARNVSDLVVESIYEKDIRIQIAHSTAELVVVQKIKTSEFFAAYILDHGHDWVTLEVRSKEVTKGVSAIYASEESLKNYGKIGLHMKGFRLRISRRNIKVLSSDESKMWMYQNKLLVRRNAVFPPYRVPPKMIAFVLARGLKGVKSVEVIRCNARKPAYSFVFDPEHSFESLLQDGKKVIDELLIGCEQEVKF